MPLILEINSIYVVKHTDDIAYSYSDNMYHYGIIHALLQSKFISDIEEITKQLHGQFRK